MTLEDALITFAAACMILAFIVMVVGLGYLAIYGG